MIIRDNRELFLFCLSCRTVGATVEKGNHVWFLIDGLRSDDACGIVNTFQEEIGHVNDNVVSPKRGISPNQFPPFPSRFTIS